MFANLIELMQDDVNRLHEGEETALVVVDQDQEKLEDGNEEGDLPASPAEDASGY